MAFELDEPLNFSFAFEGVSLPVNTVYDLLGWIMSVSHGYAVATSTSTERNYYLPMLALYAKWCRLLTPTNERNGMVHISWFNSTSDSSTPRNCILLGSTIGSPNVDDDLLDLKLTILGPNDPESPNDIISPDGTRYEAETSSLGIGDSKQIAKGANIARDR